MGLTGAELTVAAGVGVGAQRPVGLTAMVSTATGSMEVVMRVRVVGCADSAGGVVGGSTSGSIPTPELHRHGERECGFDPFRWAFVPFGLRTKRLGRGSWVNSAAKSSSTGHY